MCINFLREAILTIIARNRLYDRQEIDISYVK